VRGRPERHECLVVTYIRVSELNGDGSRFLTDGPNDTNPSWSPDANWIAFERGADIWLIDAAGKHPRKFTSDGFNPSWRAAGTTQGR